MEFCSDNYKKTYRGIFIFFNQLFHVFSERYLLICCLIIVSVLMCPTVFAQIFPPTGDLKGDKTTGDLRYEGIRQYRKYSNIILKSATIGITEKANVDQKRCHILFYVPDESLTDRIDILLDAKNDSKYYMIPKKEKWKIGVNNFSWDSGFSLQAGAHLNALYALAVRGLSDGGEQVFPLLLYYSDKSELKYVYSFIFVPTEFITLEYDLVKDGERIDLGKKTSFKKIPPNREIEIKLDFTEKEEGQYDLIIEYSTLKVSNKRYFHQLYSFYHYQRF